MAESFTRIEQKFLLDREVYENIKNRLKKYVIPDEVFKYQIMSLYFDNDNNDLIINSIDKPCFKEKIRIRSYSPPGDNDDVFVEIKKKYNGTVYKRRTKAKYKEVITDLYNAKFENKQVGEEIRKLIDKHGPIKPKIFIDSTRICYKGIEDENLRVTFDEDIKYRTDELFLNNNKHDEMLMDEIVMEIKVDKAMPLWLSKELNELKIYSRPNSKVGRAYIKQKEGMLYGNI